MEDIETVEAAPNLFFFTVDKRRIWYVDDIRVRSYAHVRRLLKCDDVLILLLKLKYGEIS